LRPGGDGSSHSFPGNTLSGAKHLGDGPLEAANLYGAYLERATLDDAHLEGARLGGAHLEAADFDNAHLERAIFADAHMGAHSLWKPTWSGLSSTAPIWSERPSVTGVTRWPEVSRAGSQGRGWRLTLAHDGPLPALLDRGDGLGRVLGGFRHSWPVVRHCALQRRCMGSEPPGVVHGVVGDLEERVGVAGLAERAPAGEVAAGELPSGGVGSPSA
jgi:Pentapeptide repeats (8 copies)